MKTPMANALQTFRGKRVFVTGHTGFKGSWLVLILKEIGAEVMGYALDPVDSTNHFDLLELNKKINHMVGDICDSDRLLKAMLGFQPDFVFHLAAQALVRPSYNNPRKTFETNIIGSVNLLEAVRSCKSVRSLVYITSDKCYENVEWIWGYRENDQLGGRDPYSASKAAAEIVFSSYSRSFFADQSDIGAATTRAGNVIGGGDWAIDRIVPDCIRSVQGGIPINVRNPNATRPWQHVLEPLSGYLLLGAQLFSDPKQFSGSWNFGPAPSDVRTVRDVAEVIFSHLGKGCINVVKSDPNVHEARLLQLNCDKANRQLGWYPRWNSDKTLEATAVWYKKVMVGENVEQVSRNQIKEYFIELI
jgi:CDP-glucose 4,6-dehydratase